MKRKRTGILVCLTLLLSTLLAAAIVQAAGYNLTYVGAPTAINGAVFEVLSPDDPSGSGLFDPFVRISSTLAQTRGYNTDYRPVQFQENNSGTFTRSRLLSDIPQVAVNGSMYREFQLDINQNTPIPARYLTLDTVELYESPFPDLCGYPFDGSGGGHTGCAVNNTATMVYDMDAGENNFVVLDYTTNEGAGKRDLKILVPDSTFSADPDCNCGGKGAPSISPSTPSLAAIPIPVTLIRSCRSPMGTTTVTRSGGCRAVSRPLGWRSPLPAHTTLP